MLTLLDFCEQAGIPHHGVSALIQTLNDRNAAELALCESRARARSAAPIPERLPLGDFGQVEASIPKRAFMYWGLRPDVGWEAWQDDQFIREYLRDNPGCRVKTVPRKVTIQSNWDSRSVRERTHYR